MPTRLQAAVPGKLSAWATTLGVAGLYLLAFSLRISTTAAYLGFILMSLMFFLHLRPYWSRISGDPMIAVLLGFSMFLIARTAWAIMELPETRGEQLTNAWEFLHLWAFTIVAWWLAGDSRRIHHILWLALASFFIGVAMRLEPATLADLLAGGRTGFGLATIAFGLYSATAALGLIVFAPRLWGTTRKRPWFIARAGLWFLLLLLALQGLIVTQSRTTWIAMVLALLPVVVLLARRWSRAPHASTLTRRAWLLGLGLALLTVIAINFNTIQQRLGAEADTLSAVTSLDYRNIPSHRMSSMGVRFHLNELGIRKWLERPWFGWGPGSTRYLIGNSENPNLRIWKDLHNSYLEILVRFGLFGFGFFAAAAWLLIKGLYQAHRQQRIPLDTYLFLCGTLIILGLWNLTDFRMIHSDWLFYWLLTGGIAYNYRMHAGASR
jgi:O-antigen ligase